MMGHMAVITDDVLAEIHGRMAAQRELLFLIECRRMALQLGCSIMDLPGRGYVRVLVTGTWTYELRHRGEFPQ